MAAKKQKVRVVSGRESFIDHIQRVEAYVNGARLSDVEKDELPEHLKNEDVAARAARIWDAFNGDKQAPKGK